MAAYDKQFLDNTGLNTTVTALWTKLKKVTPYYSEKGTDGTGGWVKFLSVKCQQYMNHPLVVHIISRGYSYSTMEIQWVSSGGSTPTVSGFYHIIRSFNGTDGKSTNVGYTYEDIDSVRYYHFWKQKNESYGILHVSVDGISKYISGSDDTGYLTFPNEHSTTEPTGIVYATEVWETVPKQTAYTAKGTATKVPQITTNAQGQVTGITEVEITGVTPASHTHGSITNDGKIGTTANLPVITGTGGAVSTGSFSTTASAVGTSSAAGTANTFSRGDHVHSISLATGDSDGQVKIAGSNVSVKGWANKTSQFSLGADSAGTRYYTMFARMSDSNTQGNGEAQVILASGAGIGATNMGTWEIIVSNRGSTASTPKATMTVRCINQTSQSAPTFGYYVDSTNHYIYFGLYSGLYRGNSTITILLNNGATLQDFGDSTTAPTGWTTVTPTGVSSAVKLDTARTIQTDLASTSSASFDGTANITPGVTGTLAIGNGGTGQTTALNIVNETIQAGLGTGDGDVLDSTDIVTSHINGYSSTNKGLYRRKATKLWSYMKGKLTSDTGVNISGNAATATKLGTSDVGSATQPIYLAAGVPTAGTTYAGGTAVTLNNSSKAGSTASFYAPTAGGTANYVLIGNGTTSSPTWAEKAPKATAADSAAKLTTARKTYVTLGTASTSTTRDWSGDTTIPVDGQLKVANGGTGSSTAAGARTNLEVYSKSEVDSMLTGRISVVASLPATGEPGVIYFVGPTGSGADQYEEYIWDGSAFIKVGEKSLDLSNYVNTLSSSGTGSVVTSLSKSGNTLTANLGNIAINNLSDWAAKSDVTISSVSYHVWWPTAPTSSNQVYGLSMKDGKLYQIYNNKGTYTARSYDQDNNTTYTNKSLGQGYGTCDTAAATAAKTATMTDYALTVGGIVAIKFTNALCASATLSINSKTAKPIYIKGAAVTADNAAAVSAGDLAYFMYDGTAYHFLGTDRAATNPIVNITRSGTTFTATRLDGSTFTFTQQDSDTTYTQEKLGQGYGTCITAEATAAKVVTLSNYELVKNGVVAIKFSNGLCASATLNINSKGAKSVFINGAAATATTCKEVQAGDIALFMYDGTQYQFLCTDRVSKSAITGLSVSDTTITYTRADASTGTITTKDTTYTFDGTYNASSNKAATVSTVTNAINALDVSNITGFGAGKTLATLTETDGKIAATFQNISITKSQVSDFSHAHGNITNGGAITATGVALASGDSLVFVDSSDSSLVKKTSITFDGSTTNSMLSKKGEWSDTIAKARAVVDYGATSKAIEIGWSGAAVTSPAYFAVYTDSANGYNKAIKDCSLANVKKVINGTSVGSTAVPVFINANGAPQVCTDDFVHDGDVTSTYSSTGTAPVNGTAVAAAIGGLDVSSVGGDGKYISAISETDGKISATATTMDTTPTASSTKAVTSGGIKTALDGKVTTFGLGELDNTAKYTMFARLPLVNTEGDYNATVLLTQSGSYGGTLLGNWLINVSNRGSSASTPKPSMEVRRLVPYNGNAPVFGYYVDTTNSYIYFGMYRPAYSGYSYVNVLGNRGATLQDFGDTTTQATNWTPVDEITFNDGIEFIVGTWTAASGTWTGKSKEQVLVDGKQILLYLPFAGSGNATLNLTLANGNTTGAKNCYWSGTSRLTTHYAQYQIARLVYKKSLNINGTNYEGWWASDRDSNSTYSGMVDAYLNNAADAAKSASSTNFKLSTGTTIMLANNVANTKNAALTLNVNGTGAKTLYINGSPSSASNYTIPVGTFPCYYDGTNWWLWTDGTFQVDQLRYNAILGEHQAKMRYHIQVNNTGSSPKGWCSILRVTKTSGYGSFDALRVHGILYDGNGNWEYRQERRIEFQAIINISSNTANLYLGKTTLSADSWIRLVKVADRDYELQYNASTANYDYDIYYQYEGNASSYVTKYTTYTATTVTGTAITSEQLLPGSIAYRADADGDGNNIKASYFKSSGNVTLVSGTATKIGTQNGTDVKLTLPTIPAAANNGALQLQLNGGTATSKFTANQSGNSTLAFSTGSTAGTFKVDSTEIAIAGFTKVEASSTNGNIKINGTETTVYTHPTTAGNKHIPSGGSSGQFLGYDSAGTAKWVSNPNTDTKQNITLATTTKAFITGVSTTPTSTAQALTGLADTGVYLTTTAGELNATQYKVNEHCTMKYNSTKSSLDFTFS